MASRQAAGRRYRGCAALERCPGFGVRPHRPGCAAQSLQQANGAVRLQRDRNRRGCERSSKHCRGSETQVWHCVHAPNLVNFMRISLATSALQHPSISKRIAHLLRCRCRRWQQQNTGRRYEVAADATCVPARYDAAPARRCELKELCTKCLAGRGCMRLTAWLLFELPFVSSAPHNTSR